MEATDIRWIEVPRRCCHPRSSAPNVAGFATNTHHLLGTPIVRFEIVVGDAPILHGDIFGKMRSAEFFSQASRQDELGFEKTEGISIPVLARPATPEPGRNEPYWRTGTDGSRMEWRCVMVSSAMFCIMRTRMA